VQRRCGFLLGLLWLGIVCLGASAFAGGGTKLRVGYFPNITHAQAVLGMADGTFQKALGDEAVIEQYVFNAGPSVIEAMMSGNLDLAYIGPNPAVNGYLKTDGILLRIIAGAASGGAALVLRSDLGVKRPAELTGKRLASPQLGNTQDVSLRFYLLKHRLKLKEKGGTVEVIPVANPDQLTLFRKKEIDGAWTVEPWVSRLVSEAGGTVFLDERSIWPKGKFVTANIIVSAKFLKEHPDLVKKWLRAHVRLTQRINAAPLRAQRELNQELKNITGQALPEEILRQAFTRFELTYDPLPKTLIAAANSAFELGFLGKKRPDLRHIYDLTLLNQVLQEQKLPRIRP
jgi:NitT/TauT family transport system substrate-binding protein